MKKYILLFVCVLLISNTLVISASATEIDNQNDQILVSETVEYISDDLLMYAPAQVTVAKEKGVKRSSGLGSWLGK